MAYIDKAFWKVMHIIFGFKMGYVSRQTRVGKLNVSLLWRTQQVIEISVYFQVDAVF